MLTPHFDGVWMWRAYSKLLGHEGSALLNRIRAVIKEALEGSLPFLPYAHKREGGGL